MLNAPLVFISHSHEDNNRCAILLETMRDWPIRIWFDRDQLDAGDPLTKRLQDAIEESRVFIRVCTTAMQKRSYWVDLETDAFRALVAKDENAGLHGKRTLISLILDRDYQPQPFELAAISINAFSKPSAEWLNELRRALKIDRAGVPSTQLPPPPSGQKVPIFPFSLSRNRMIVLMIAILLLSSVVLLSKLGSNNKNSTTSRRQGTSQGQSTEMTSPTPLTDATATSVPSTPHSLQWPRYFNTIVMVSQNEGWAAGDGDMAHYLNGQWTLVLNPAFSPTTPGQGNEMQSIAMPSPTEGWAVGGNSYPHGNSREGYSSTLNPSGSILHYLNGKWLQVASPTQQPLYSVAMLSQSEGWAVGENGVILHYAQGQWKVATSPTQQPLYSVALYSAMDGWAVGQGTILHYDGINWSAVAASQVTFTSVSLSGATDGWAVGNNGNNFVFAHEVSSGWTSVDDSANLGSISANTPFPELFGVQMLSPSDGWAVGSGYVGFNSDPDISVILHDVGGQWKVVPNPYHVDLLSIWMLSDSEGWAVGYDAIFHYSNGQWSLFKQPY